VMEGVTTSLEKSEEVGFGLDLSKYTQIGMGRKGGGRGFQRRRSEFLEVWAWMGGGD
jgi:hypothetical protein